MNPLPTWNLTSESAQVFLAPRDIPKIALVGKAINFARTSTWTGTYVTPTQLISVIDSLNTVQYSGTLSRAVWIDIALTSANRLVITWEDGDGNVNIRYATNDANTIFSNLSFVGKTPVCCRDNAADAPANACDVVVFYTDGINIYYRIQAENYATAHLLTVTAENLTLVNCGMTADDTLSVQVAREDCILIAVGDSPLYVGNDFVGYPWGIIPWARN